MRVVFLGIWVDARPDGHHAGLYPRADSGKKKKRGGQQDADTGK